MSKLAEMVQRIQKNPPICTRYLKQRMKLELEGAFNEDLETIREGELGDPDQFVGGLLLAVDGLIDVFVECTIKED